MDGNIMRTYTQVDRFYQHFAEKAYVYFQENKDKYAYSSSDTGTSDWFEYGALVAIRTHAGHDGFVVITTDDNAESISYANSAFVDDEFEIETSV
jgi:hypothetical protein